MAFVHRTVRDFGHAKSTSKNHVGPGTYDTFVKNKKTQLSYAPFSSSEERVISSGTGDFVPGPGAYSAAASHNKYAAPAAVSSSQFISKVTRFGQNKQSYANAPGPGAYNHKKSWIKNPSKARSKQRKKSTKVAWVRVQQAPSIPAPNQSYGYEENHLGELVPQVQPLAREMHSGVGDDRVGPGYYDPNFSGFQ